MRVPKEPRAGNGLPCGAVPKVSGLLLIDPSPSIAHEGEQAV